MVGKANFFPSGDPGSPMPRDWHKETPVGETRGVGAELV